MNCECDCKTAYSLTTHYSRFHPSPRDITDDVLIQEKIKTQNKVLRVIAFSQSHEVRRPLANILAVIEVLKTSGAITDLEIFDHLAESAHQLDRQIRNIVQKTNNIDNEAFW